jgi:GTP-binding protein
MCIIPQVQIEVDAEYSGVVVERMTNRKGNLVDFKEHRGKNRLIFTAPTRGLVRPPSRNSSWSGCSLTVVVSCLPFHVSGVGQLGFVTEIKTETRGTAVVNRLFKEYSDKVGAIEGLKRGKLISMDAGQSTAYALNMLEDRGHLFIHPGPCVRVCVCVCVCV